MDLIECSKMAQMPQSDLSPGSSLIGLMDKVFFFFTELQSWLRSTDYTQHPNSDFSEYVVVKDQDPKLRLTDNVFASRYKKS